MRVSAAAKQEQAEAKRFFLKVVNDLRKTIVHIRKKKIEKAKRKVPDRTSPITQTLIAVYEPKETYIGWAKYNKHDPFNRSIGIVTAYKRTLPLKEVEEILDGGQDWRGIEIPKAVRNTLVEFVGRVKQRLAEDAEPAN